MKMLHVSSMGTCRVSWSDALLSVAIMKCLRIWSLNVCFVNEELDEGVPLGNRWDIQILKMLPFHLCRDVESN